MNDIMSSKLRERKAILSASLIASFLLLFLVIPTPVYSQASSHLEPQQINVEIIQGQTLIKKRKILVLFLSKRV